MGRRRGLRLRGGSKDFFRRISPFEVVDATRDHLYFSLRGMIEDFWRVFFSQGGR